MDETFSDGRFGGQAPEPPPVLKRDRKALRGAAPDKRQSAPEPQPGPAPSPTPAEPVAAEWNPFAELDEQPNAVESTPAYEQPSYEQPSYEQPAYEQPAFEAPRFEAPAAFSWPPASAASGEAPADSPSDAFGLVADAAPTPVFANDGLPAAVVPDYSAFPAGPVDIGHPIFGDLTPTVREEPQQLKVLDASAMVAAVVLPPVGLVLAIVASVRGRLFRGWVSTLARVALRVSLVMIVVFAMGGAYLLAQESKRAEAQAAVDAAAAQHAAVVADSAPFCEALAASPAAFTPDDSEYGWPALDDPAGYQSAISAYAVAWQSLVPLAPEGVTEQVASFSARVDSIVAIAKGLQANNRAGDLLTLHEQGDIATIAAYTGEYCG